MTLLLLAASPVFAEEEFLFWENCVQEAAKNHPELISASEKVEQSRAEKAAVKSGLFPQITLNASGQREQFVMKNLVPGLAPGTFVPQTGTTLENTYVFKVTGRQTLFDGFKTFSGVSSSSKKLSASEYGRAVVSSNLRLQLRESFIKLLKAQEFLVLAEDIHKRRQKNLGLVSLRYKGGREHRGALLTAEAYLAQAEFEIEQAKRNIELSQIKLLKELGRAGYSPVAVKGGFELSDSGKNKPDFELLAGTVPLLKKMISLKEAAQYDLKAAKADYYPKVYVDAALGRTDYDFPPSYTSWLLGLNASFPLFDGSRRSAEVKKSESLLRQYGADEKREKDKVVCILAETWTSLRDAVEEIKVKEKFLEASQERANIANAQYSTGFISFNEWIIIEDSLVNSQKLFLDVKANALVKEAYWLQAKGETLEYD